MGDDGRLLQRVIRSTGIARKVEVFNVEGAGGTIGLVSERETDDALPTMMGLVMVGAVKTNDSAVKLINATLVGGSTVRRNHRGAGDFGIRHAGGLRRRPGRRR